jgi:hypothetical protein
VLLTSWVILVQQSRGRKELKILRSGITTEIRDFQEYYPKSWEYPAGAKEIYGKESRE